MLSNNILDKESKEHMWRSLIIFSLCSKILLNSTTYQRIGDLFCPVHISWLSLSVISKASSKSFTNQNIVKSRSGHHEKITRRFQKRFSARKLRDLTRLSKNFLESPKMLLIMHLIIFAKKTLLRDADKFCKAFQN